MFACPAEILSFSDPTRPNAAIHSFPCHQGKRGYAVIGAGAGRKVGRKGKKGGKKSGKN